MSAEHSFYSLHSDDCTVVVDCRGDAPAILYWGERLGEATTPEMLGVLATRQEAQARPEFDSPISLSPQAGAGFMGTPGIAVQRDDGRWAVYSRIDAATAGDDNSLAIVSTCRATQLRIEHRLQLDAGSNVLRASTEVTNIGESNIRVDACNAPCIPVPMHYDQIIGFEGRWAHEFQMHHVERSAGTYLRENRAGRTSHDNFPGVIVHARNTSEEHGAAIALHLGWSGNHRLLVEELSDGRCHAQLGELLLPGEVTLAPGESYRSPELFGVHSNAGLSGASRRLHRFVRSRLTDARVQGKLKPVHFNTWEAAYFDLTMPLLLELADAAADIGAERFVLDDGWFRHRRSDRAGLGDWYVEESIFPKGLTPLADHVNAHGMEFGLWIEPEMVNPDSDLYRAHPDWALSVPEAPTLMARHQLVLDLTRKEVTDYLFERIDALLSAYPITYLKWDMNRDLAQPGNQHGKPATHHQTRALYALLERVRKAHSSVEIESCSSGGARTDYGVLAHTDRVWTSDSNDALDRLRIQKGFSMFFPAEVMGAHVGPRDCHITGRTLSMATRAAVALFGDMGVEANLLTMDDAEKDELRAAIALHKKHRALIFSGDLVRLEPASHEHAFGIVSPDRQEALFSYAVTATPPHSAPARLCFRGLDPDALYTVELIWPTNPFTYTESVLDVISKTPITGAALMNAGMQLPILHPETVLVFHLKA
ncbi:MAG: alpha-galactosidase [Pseudomonadota bacterium]